MILQNSSFVPLHPLFLCTICYCFGVILASFLVSLSTLLVSTGLCILVLLFLFYDAYLSQRLFFVTLCITLCPLIGFYRYTQGRNSYATIIKKLTAGPCDITATVQNINERQSKVGKYTVTVTSTSLKRRDAREPLNATIQINLLHSPPFEVGDTLLMSSLLIKESHQRSFQEYLEKEGIHATLFLPTLHTSVLNTPLFSIQRFFHKTRMRIDQALKKKLSSASYSLVCALFIGSKPLSGTYKHIRKQFSWWGMLHYLARSGLHVILVISAWNWLLRFINIGFFLKQVLLLILVIVYNALTVSSISFVRAFITYLFYKAATLASVSYTLLHAFTLTCALILLYNPLQLFFLDFQLSFGLTLALAWFRELSLIIQRHYNIIENK